MMAEMLPIKQFKAIYVVDLCKSLCKEAANKVRQKGWTNVHVIECDACTFEPPEGVVTLVTFSYSLTSKCSVPTPLEICCSPQAFCLADRPHMADHEVSLQQCCMRQLHQSLVHYQ